VIKPIKHYPTQLNEFMVGTSHCDGHMYLVIDDKEIRLTAENCKALAHVLAPTDSWSGVLNKDKS
jgi:hypothetical protein